VSKPNKPSLKALEARVQLARGGGQHRPRSRQVVPRRPEG